jgi:dipeptidyl aminopeptidase/acylaminoacyl peptidase
MMLRALSLAIVVTCLAAPAFAAPPLEAYGRLPAVDAISLSPSGDRFAFIGVKGEDRKLYVATVDGKPLLQAATGQAKVRGLEWAGDDHLLVITSATIPIVGFAQERLELDTIVSINLKTLKSVVLLSDVDKYVPYAFGYDGVAQVGGRWYAYLPALTRERGGDQAINNDAIPDLFRVDLDTGDAVRVATGTLDGDKWLIDPTNGEIIARSSYVEKSGDWRVYSGDIGGKLLAAGNGKYGGAGLDRGRTADTVLIDEPRADGGSNLQEMSLSGAAVGPAIDGDTVANLEFDRLTHLWTGTLAPGDRPELKMFAPDLEAKVRGVIAAFPNQSVDFRDHNEGFTKLIVFTSGTADSGTYYFVDLATGRATAVGYDYPDIGPNDVGTIEMIDYKAADGMPLHGVLDLPPGREPKNLPVVVLPHGGPQVRDYPTFDWWTEAFVSRGYAVFRPNYRGSGDLGTPFRNAGFGEWGRKMETDITDGLADLARRGIVDPKRACIVGWSYGGYASLAGVTVQNGFYRCSVAGGAVSHPGEMIDMSRGETSNAVERYWESYMGAKSALQTQLTEITPVSLARRADAPILLIHGRDDTVVPFVQMSEMQAALQSAGKPVEVLILPTSDHWLLHEDMRTMMVKASVAFVEKYNPPDPAPPAAQTQVSSASAAPRP